MGEGLHPPKIMIYLFLGCKRFEYSIREVRYSNKTIIARLVSKFKSTTYLQTTLEKPFSHVEYPLEQSPKNILLYL